MMPTPIHIVASSCAPKASTLTTATNNGAVPRING
jgi:hypothetical protein